VGAGPPARAATHASTENRAPRGRNSVHTASTVHANEPPSCNNKFRLRMEMKQISVSTCISLVRQPTVYRKNTTKIPAKATATSSGRENANRNDHTRR